MTTASRTGVQGRQGTDTRAAVGDEARSQRIVVGVADGSSRATHALRWAMAEAQRRRVPCQVIEVWTPSTIDTLDARSGHHRIDEQRAETQETLSTLVNDILVDFPSMPAPEVQVCAGDPIEVLTDAARNGGLLVVGAQRHGLSGRLIGSVSAGILHRRVGATVVVPPEADTRGHHGRVVVGVDGSDAAARALSWAYDEAHRRQAQLVVLHTWRTPTVVTSRFTPADPALVEDCEKAASQILTAALKQIEPGADVAVVPSLKEGWADAELVKAAADADLLVVGSRGRGGLAAAALGSTSRSCVHRSPCAVAVIR